MSTLRTNALEGVDAKNSITIVAGAGNITTTNVQQGLVKCWFKADMNTENDLEDSFNTSSVSDEGTGTYHWNMTNGLENTRGAYSGATGRTGNPNVSGVNGVIMNSTSQWDVNTTNNSGSEADTEVGAMGVGDLA